MLQTANDNEFRPLVESVSHRQKFMAGSIQTRPGGAVPRNTRMRDEERRAKELQFQMRLLESMISDGVPRHKQPVWALAFHEAANLIQRIWRVRDKKRQARKITEIMDDKINVFMEQTEWGGWEVVNDPFKLLAARQQAAELFETDSECSETESDSDASSSEASDDEDVVEDDHDDCDGEDDMGGADGSDDKECHADSRDGENEDDDLLRQWRRNNTFDGNGSKIPGRSATENNHHPLPSKAKSHVALMLRDMNNRLKHQLSRASCGQDIDAVSRMSRRLLRVGSSLAALQEDHVRTAQQGSSDRSSAMSNVDESGQDPNSGGNRSSATSSDELKHGPGGDDRNSRSRAKQVMAVFKMAARTVGKVNDTLQRLRNHQASSMTTVGLQGGSDEGCAEAARNDLKKYARRAHFQVKGLQDAMVAELKHTSGEQGNGEILKDTESVQALIKNRLMLLTSLAEDTDGYNGIVLSPAAEGPLDGWKFDAMHRELTDLCSSINQVKKEIKHNSRTVIRNQSTQPQLPFPSRAAPSLPPGSDGTVALGQASVPAPLQPSVTMKSRAQSPEDGRKRLDPISRDTISRQHTRAKFKDEKSGMSCQVGLFREAAANPKQSLPPITQKGVDVPTSSSPLLHPGNIRSQKFNIDDILQAQRQRAHEQPHQPLGRSGRRWSTDLAKEQSMKATGGFKISTAPAGSLMSSPTSLKQKPRRVTMDMPVFLKGNTVETRGAENHAVMPAVEHSPMSLPKMSFVPKAPGSLSQRAPMVPGRRRVTML